MKRKMALVLLISFFLCMPVRAQELNGGADISAAGQTTVIAQVESTEHSAETSEVETGDKNKTITYASLFILSTMVILVSQIRAMKNE